MPESINLDNYADLRDISRQFCGTLHSQAGGYLETTRLLFRPGAVFGPYIVGSHKDNPRDAAVAFASFKAYFAEVAASKPLSLDSALPDAFEIPFATPVLNPSPIPTRSPPAPVPKRSPSPVLSVGFSAFRTSPSLVSASSPLPPSVRLKI